MQQIHKTFYTIEICIHVFGYYSVKLFSLSVNAFISSHGFIYICIFVDSLYVFISFNYFFLFLFLKCCTFAVLPSSQQKKIRTHIAFLPAVF